MVFMLRFPLLFVTFLVAAHAPDVAHAATASPQSVLRCSGGGFFDQPGRFFRMRDVRRMARTNFYGLGIGALGHLALVFRIDRSVLRSHQVPTGFRLPGRSSNWRCERVLGK